ncbi:MULTISPECIES: patatin-like phospholipase family protein [unclassified Moraxella]|uniref:patatin-like phospholipase family protein n=1 Tax=unclassified Moraxella TaxID=2685852 RepID=UPI003AF81D98
MNAPTLTPKPFNRAMLFSGGGLRFGYYLGMYQALCDHDKQPDIILASCGGAFVAGLLEVSQDSKQAYERLISRECYEMLCRIEPNRPKRPTDYALPALARYLNSLVNSHAKMRLAHNLLSSHRLSADKLLAKLHAQSLAHIKDESDRHPLWHWQDYSPNTDFNSIILSSRLLSTYQHQPWQWQLVLRTSHSALADKLENLSLSNVMANYHVDKIHPTHYITAEMPLPIAVRGSISDMYYLPPMTWQGQTLMGGVLNLTPIELACQLADTVYAETKAGYDGVLAEPAIQDVFGFSPNHRLAHVHDYQHPHTQIHWLNTADNGKHIRPVIAKKLRLRQGYIDVKRPDYATFQAIMREQYDYGYERAKDYLGKI